MQVQVIIAGGGKGKRMGEAIAKQFLYLGKRRIAEYTMDAFINFVPNALIWVVVAIEYLDMARSLWKDYPQIMILPGDRERFFSVKVAVEQIHSNGLVFVHDMVRPFVSLDLLKRCYHGTIKHGSAIPQIKSASSIRYQGKPLDRNQVTLIQTPQTFRADWLKQAFKQDFCPEFTDEASVVERAGYPLYFVPGEYHNIKITYPEDLQFAEYLCQQKQFTEGCHNFYSSEYS